PGRWAAGCRSGDRAPARSGASRAATSIGSWRTGPASAPRCPRARGRWCRRSRTPRSPAPRPRWAAPARARDAMTSTVTARARSARARLRWRDARAGRSRSVLCSGSWSVVRDAAVVEPDHRVAMALTALDGEDGTDVGAEVDLQHLGALVL